MATHDIARETWAAFFDDFSKQHRNLRVTVTTVSPGADGPQTVQSGQPFASIALDQANGEAGAVVLTMGGDGDAATHRIERPTRVYHKTGPDVLMTAEVEHGEALEITSQNDPPITYIHVHTPPGQGHSEGDATITAI
jgi:hypothetical protein